MLLSVPSELAHILFLIRAAGVSMDRDRLLLSERVAAGLEVKWSEGSLPLTVSFHSLCLEDQDLSLSVYHNKNLT